MRHFYLNRLISHFFLSVLTLVITFELRISKNKNSSEYFFGTWSLNYLGGSQFLCSGYAAIPGSY